MSVRTFIGFSLCIGGGYALGATVGAVAALGVLAVLWGYVILEVRAP